MPMLITLRIGLPVCPVHSPQRTRSENAAIRSSTSWTSLDDVLAVDDQRALPRHPQRDVQHGAVLGDVDVLAGEHRVAALRAARTRSASSTSSLERLVGDPVLRVVEEEAGALGGQPLAAVGVLGEQIAQVPLADLGVVLLQGVPRGALPSARSCGLRWGRARCPRPRSARRPRPGPRSRARTGAPGVASPRIGSTTRHAASTASSRANSVGSPRIASPSRRSYGGISSGRLVGARAARRPRRSSPRRDASPARRSAMRDVRAEREAQ